MSGEELKLKGNVLWCARAVSWRWIYSLSRQNRINTKNIFAQIKKNCRRFYATVSLFPLFASVWQPCRVFLFVILYETVQKFLSPLFGIWPSLNLTWKGRFVTALSCGLDVLLHTQRGLSFANIAFAQKKTQQKNLEKLLSSQRNPCFWLTLCHLGTEMWVFAHVVLSSPQNAPPGFPVGS